MMFDFKREISKSIKNWNIITDPYRGENEFKQDRKKTTLGKKYADSNRFSDTRFFTVSSGSYFLSPMEEYNYAWRKDYYGRNRRASVNLDVLKRGTYSVTDDFYGLDRF